MKLLGATRIPFDCKGDATQPFLHELPPGLVWCIDAAAYGELGLPLDAEVACCNMPPDMPLVSSDILVEAGWNNADGDLCKLAVIKRALKIALVALAKKIRERAPDQGFNRGNL